MLAGGPGFAVQVEVGELRRVEHRLLDPGAALHVVVAHHPQADLEQQSQGHQVDEGQAGHGDVGEGEHGGQVLHRAPDHQGQHQRAVADQHQAVAAEELQAVLAQVEVVEDAGEDEQRQGHADEHPAPVADHRGQGVLGEDDAVAFEARGVEAREQDQQGGAGADHEGVEEHAEGLDHALRRRMAHGGDRGDVRRAAQAGLVGEDAALDAHHDGAAE